MIEMCIRDSFKPDQKGRLSLYGVRSQRPKAERAGQSTLLLLHDQSENCLLYTSRFTPNRTLVSSRPHTILYGNSPSFRFFIIIGIAESTGHYTYICKDSTIILKNILFYLFDRKTCEVFMRPAMIGYLLSLIHILSLSA